ncbi:MAG: hypothetical protein ACK5Q5_04565 [Planctomycetaceae bacterium]
MSHRIEGVGLVRVDLTSIVNELQSLVLLLQASKQNTEFSDEQKRYLTDSTRDRIEHLRRSIPATISSADCDGVGRDSLRKLVELLGQLPESLFRDGQCSGLELPNVCHALESLLPSLKRAAHRQSAEADPAALTEVARSGLFREFGARLSAADWHEGQPYWRGQPDDAVVRVNAGMREAMRRYPETLRWGLEDWEFLFGSTRQVIAETVAWKSLLGMSESSDADGSMTRNDLARELDVDAATIGRYAAAAGIKSGKRGGASTAYSVSDVTAILSYIVNQLPKSPATTPAKRLLETLSKRSGN